MHIETHRNAFNMTASVFGIGNVLPNSSVYDHNLPQAFQVLCFFITHFKYSVFKLSAKYHSFPVNLTTEFGNSVLLGMIFFEIIRNWVNNLQLFFFFETDPKQGCANPFGLCSDHTGHEEKTTQVSLHILSSLSCVFWLW